MKILLALLLAMTAATSWAESNASDPSPDGNTATASTLTVQAKPPLNKYGAVDVDADVPYDQQVPNKPDDFQDPQLNPMAQSWSSILPAQPPLEVRSYLLMSANSGQIIAAYNANKREAPASLTKLMLIYITQQELAQGNIHLKDKVSVPTVAWATGGSRMFLKPNEQVTLENLIKGTLVASGNDAAVTIANHIAGKQSAFVSMMNHQAQLLGMTDTHFADVMGLPAPNHYSTARDLGVLAQAIVTKYPQDISWFGQKYFEHNGIKQSNFNKLLFIDPDALGLKTGSTKESGYSLVSAAQKEHNPMMLIGVVMGAKDGPMASARASQALLTYGFRYFGERMLYSANSAIKTVPVKGGAKDDVAIGLHQDLWVTFPKTLAQDLTGKLKIKQNLKAPINKGQQVGSIIISLKSKQLASKPVYALQTVKKGNFWQRWL